MLIGIWRGRSRERSPLRPQHSTSYGAFGPDPRLHDSQPPPPYGEVPEDFDDERHAHPHQQDSSPLRFLTTTKGRFGTSTILFVILVQAIAFIFFYDLPTKLDEYSKATARMREQQGTMREEAKHLESERIALQGESNRLEKERSALESSITKIGREKDALESAIRRSEEEAKRLESERIALQGESNRLEKERQALESSITKIARERDALECAIRRSEEEVKHLQNERIALRRESDRLEKERMALESSTLKMEKEKDALESAIRRSELERSKFEREKQLLEDKRQLLKQEKEELQEEREKWEKAREDRVPQGAFWSSEPMPAWDCRAYGRREYWAILQNIPEDWTDLDACMNMPVEIKGVTVRRPDRCEYYGDPLHVRGIWMVNWDQIDCQPWHQDLTDTVSLEKRC